MTISIVKSMMICHDIINGCDYTKHSGTNITMMLIVQSWMIFKLTLDYYHSTLLFETYNDKAVFVQS